MEGEDFTVQKFVNGRATVIDYHLTIETAKELAMVENNEKANSPNIVGYQTMRAPVKLGNESLAVRFVFGKDDKGVYHYDHTIHADEVVFDSANGNGPAEASPFAKMGGNQGFCTAEALYPDLPAYSPPNRQRGIWTISFFDEAGQKVNAEVLNLFIEGEEPEVVDGEVTDEPVILPYKFSFITPAAANLLQTAYASGRAATSTAP